MKYDKLAIVLSAALSFLPPLGERCHLAPAYFPSILITLSAFEPEPTRTTCHEKRELVLKGGEKQYICSIGRRAGYRWSNPSLFGGHMAWTSRGFDPSLWSIPHKPSLEQFNLGAVTVCQVVELLLVVSPDR